LIDLFNLSTKKTRLVLNARLNNYNPRLRGRDIAVVRKKSKVYTLGRTSFIVFKGHVFTRITFLDICEMFKVSRYTYASLTDIDKYGQWYVFKSIRLYIYICYGQSGKFGQCIQCPGIVYNVRGILGNVNCEVFIQNNLHNILYISYNFGTYSFTLVVVYCHSVYIM
jgi:hypothetical protein